MTEQVERCDGCGCVLVGEAWLNLLGEQRCRECAQVTIVALAFRPTRPEARDDGR